MNDMPAFQKALADHLTFYHECLVPKHPYFTGTSNYNDKDEFVVVSSPSRMGNHALMSILDNHPELPRIPGEDSFLRHSFFECTYNLNAYLKNIRGPRNTSYIRNLSSFPADTDKWAKLKDIYNTQAFPELHAGIQFPTNRLIIADYQDVLIDINYDEYTCILDKATNQISATSSFSELLVIYLSALSMLDPKGNNTRFLSTYANSGMRRQCLWLCHNFPKVRILTSIRRFESYAVSHIRSRYRVVEFKAEWIKEAWEHWYHKIIDYFWIKVNFPENIMLIPFEDISGNTELVAQEISQFLGINYNESMLTATVFGQPNKGNSSKRRDDTYKGKFYASSELLPIELIPESVYAVENALQYGKYS